MDNRLDRVALGAVLWLHVLGGARSTTCLAQILRTEPDKVHAGLEQLRELGLVCQSTTRWHLEPFPPYLRRYFMELLGAGDADLQTRCVIKLCDGECLEAYGELQELTEELIASSHAKGASACLQLLIERLGRWDVRDREHAALRMFIDLLLMAQSNSFYLGVCMKQAQDLSKQANAVARMLGDSRTQALVALITGCLGSLSGSPSENPIKTLNQGIEAINNMGDADILGQASHFLSFLHYVQGNFKGTFRHFEAAQHWTPMFKCRYFSEMYPIYIAPSSMYLGLLAQALGVTLSALHTAEAKGNTNGVLWWNVLLGVIYLRIGMPQHALPHLDKVALHADVEANPKLHLWIWRTLALYHAETGNMATAHRLFLRCLQERLQFDKLRFAYTAPWILDLFYRFEEHGLPPLPEYAVDEECALVLQGANGHLHGAAYRIQARKLWKRDGNRAETERLFQKSVECFNAASNTLEVAVTTQMLAAFLAKEPIPEHSEHLRRDTALVINAYIPRPVTVFSPRGSLSDRAWRGYYVEAAASLESCLTLLGRIDLATPMRQALGRIVTTVQCCLGAERALLLRHTPAEGWSLECSSNCSDSEYSRMPPDASLGKHVALLSEERFALLVDRKRVSLCLKIPTSDGVCLFLTLESAILAGPFIRLSDQENAALALRVATEIRTSLKIEAVRRAEMESRQTCIVAAMEERTPSLRFDNGHGLHEVLGQAKYAALSDAPILLMGETGVGKEVLARRIHEFSGRKGAFVAVMPVSTPETLFESEFFGHEKGAFTGAVKQKTGLFELANDGTFFIDEVGELPLSFQTKFLRVLQEKSFMRVGGTRSIVSNFRLLTATNRDLWAEVRNGNFREDLYYRISIIPITIPPLRDRAEDIPGLAQMFIEDFAARYHKQLPALGKEEMQAFKRYHWPGNVRELKNVVERAVILSSHDRLNFLFGPGQPISPTNSGENTSLYADFPTLQELSIRYMRHVLRHTDGRIIGPDSAESILGMKRSTLYAKLREFGLR